MQASCVGLCGDSYYIKWSDGEQEWDEIPPRLDNILKGRKTRHNPVDFLSLGPDSSWFVRFENNKILWSDNLPSTLDDLLQDPPSDLCDLVLGPDDTWALKCDDSWEYSSNLASEIERKIQRKSVQKLTLGGDDTFVTQYENGFLEWKLDEGKSEKIKAFRNNNIGQLVLDSEDESNYFFSSGKKVFCKGSESFEDAIFDEYDHHVLTSDARYLHTSINFVFTDGRTIYSLASKLAEGKIGVDEVPTIRVVCEETYDDRTLYWSMDNRRLWAFKAAGLKCIPVTFVQPNGQYYSFKEKALDNGISINIRSNAQ